jgi:hypothetical protein
VSLTLLPLGPSPLLLLGDVVEDFVLREWAILGPLLKMGTVFTGTKGGFCNRDGGESALLTVAST